VGSQRECRGGQTQCGGSCDVVVVFLVVVVISVSQLMSSRN
jgi:hypothetical protein